MDKGSATKGKRSARARKKVMFRDDDDDMYVLICSIVLGCIAYIIFYIQSTDDTYDIFPCTQPYI